MQTLGGELRRSHGPKGRLRYRLSRDRVGGWLIFQILLCAVCAATALFSVADMPRAYGAYKV